MPILSHFRHHCIHLMLRRFGYTVAPGRVNGRAIPRLIVPAQVQL